ncbi:MAG: hypothetical protein WEG40_16345 [Candidatus Rokuibacteriota bacterium]
MGAGSAGPIPEDVRRFIIEHIDSVPALEALLLMRRSAERRFTVAMLAAELYMDPRQVAPILSELGTRGLCGTSGGAEPMYFWRPATAEMADALGRLADVHARYLVPVTNLIHGKPRASLRGFSDAFRLRGNE